MNSIISTYEQLIGPRRISGPKSTLSTNKKSQESPEERRKREFEEMRNRLFDQRLARTQAAGMMQEYQTGINPLEVQRQAREQMLNQAERERWKAYYMQPWNRNYWEDYQSSPQRAYERATREASQIQRQREDLAQQRKAFQKILK